MPDQWKTSSDNTVELITKSASELSKLIRHREVSVVELAKASLRAVSQVNDEINAMVCVDEQSVLARAQYLDDLANQQKFLGPLHGLPIGVKDLFDTAGLTTTYGSPIYQNHVPLFNHDIVNKELAAGGLILGKTNLPDFAYGGNTTNQNYGETFNPFDTRKSTSGSGGGGAAALATGMVALADGSDVGGSVRSPAAWCGVVGYKPTAHYISRAPAGMLNDPIEVFGVMGRCVEDTALFASALTDKISRLDGADQHQTLERLRKPLSVVLAIPDFVDSKRFAAEVYSLFQQQLSVIQNAQIEITSIKLELEPLLPALKIVRYYKMHTELGFLLQQRKQEIPEHLLSQMIEAQSVTVSQYETSLGVLHNCAQQWSDGFKSYDYIVTPTCSSLAHNAGDWQADKNTCYDQLFVANALGWPAISIPAGFTSDGIPFGLQLISPAHTDQQLLQTARLLEQLLK